MAKKAEDSKKEAPKEKKSEKKKAADNVVFVGRKPTMSYVLAVITQFNDNMKEVHIKARGRSISRAVDVSEIVKNRFLGDVKVKSIETGTEERVVEDGNKINVSTIDLTLVK
jgi:DNA-binding protein